MNIDSSSPLADPPFWSQLAQHSTFLTILFIIDLLSWHALPNFSASHPKVKFRRPSLPSPPPKSRGEGRSQKFQIRKKFLCERKTPRASFEFPDQLVYHRPIVQAGVLKFDPILIILMTKRLNHLLFNKLFSFFLFIEVNSHCSKTIECNSWSAQSRIALK